MFMRFIYLLNNGDCNSRLAPVRASNNFIVNIQVRLKPGLEQSS